MYEILFKFKNAGTVRYKITEIILVPVSVLACALMAINIFYWSYKLAALTLSLLLLRPLSLAVILLGGILWKKIS
jgi:nitrogen fixation-related uncharacterized protein